jgi:glyoxalase superfamily protein
MTWLHAVIDVPAGRHAATAAFWGSALGWPAGEPWDGHPELRSFEPPSGTAYVHLQEIDGPPRLHLDVEAADPAAAVDRAVALGAEVVAEHDRWRTLRSPGGLPFCVLAARAHPRPGPVTHAGGHRARMVQVCVDSPASSHDREVAFWRELLQGRFVESGAAEFAGKWHDDVDSPLQILFQRLDEPEGPVRAHLDHGTDDVDAEVRRLLDLGADDLGRGPGGWHVLRDPAAQVFCVTGNSPELLAHRELD